MSAITAEARVSVGGAGLAVATGLALGAALSLAPLTTVGVVGVAVLASALLALPRRWLWWVALGLFAFVPISWLPVPDLLSTLSPPMFVVALLTFRLLLRPPTRLRVTVSGGVLFALAAWLSLCMFLSPYRAVGVGWLISFLMLTCLPAAAGMLDAPARKAISRCWVVVAAALGAFAVLETYVLQGNPIYGSLFAAADPELVQHWSVYRATTTLGHPVDNGVFFALAVPLALGRLLRRPRWGSGLAVLLIFGGVVGSGSRAALVAGVLGAAVAVFAPHGGGSVTPVRTGRRLAITVLVFGLAGAGVLTVSQRAGSDEAALSTDFRRVQVGVAADAVAASPVVGVGPGAASLSRASALDDAGGAGAFESLWLELVVGAGIPGLLLFGVLLLCALARALRVRAADVAGSLTAYLVVASSYNLLEGGRPAHLQLGLLLAMAFSATRATPRPLKSAIPRQPAPVSDYPFQHPLQPVHS